LAIPAPPADLLVRLQRFDPRVQRLMLRAREYVWRHFKPETEVVFEVKYTVTVWFGRPGKLKERTVYMAAFSSHINIGFLYGAELPDPDRILKGAGKQMRHVQIKSPENLDSAPLAAVLKAARIALVSN
jgi:hypothetical protein